MTSTLVPDFSDVTGGSSSVAIESDIPGAGPALTWLRNKLAEWDSTESRLRKLQHDAAQLSYVAQQQGDTAAAAQLDGQIYRLGELAQKRAETADTLAPVRQWMQSKGFGIVVPLIIAGAAVLAVAAVASVISQTTIEEQKLDLVARRILTPEQYAQLQKSTPALFNFDLGKLVPYALVGVGGWLLVKWLKGNGRGAQLWA